MNLYIAGVALTLLGGVAAWLLASRPALSRWLGGAAIALSSLFFALPLAGFLLHDPGGPPASSLQLPWALPLGAGAVGLDALSAFFALIVCFVTGLAALYGIGYMKGEDGHARSGHTWLLLSILQLSMLGVVVARDGILFLIAWETMALSSFALVVFDHRSAAVRRAGIWYLLASQVGAAALFLLFLTLSNGDAAMLFSHMSCSAAPGLCFLLALLGFGLKAGLFPLHGWLPEAHSAAPSHVSAVMSAVMLKMGAYGFLRFLTFVDGPVPLWWPATLLVLGGAGALYGLLMALVNADIKRILAFSSAENMGIVFLAMGVGLLGRHLAIPSVEWLGYSAAILHSLNHALFKGLLFMGAGAIISATGTRSLEALGGMARNGAKALAILFFVGTLAIAGLPPMNGFLGELLLYTAAWRNVANSSHVVAALAVAIIIVLALVGALAIAAFGRLFGAAFLGTPRTQAAAQPKPTPYTMLLPMLVLALANVSIALAAPWLPALLARPVQSLGVSHYATVVGTVTVFAAVASVGATLLMAVALLWAARRFMGRRYAPRSFVTWDCGYAAPSQRMQYTASSFAQPITEMFRWLGLASTKNAKVSGPFPADTSYESQPQDVATSGLFLRLTTLIQRSASASKVIQGGRIQVYIMYILVVLLALVLFAMEAQPWN